MSAAFDFAGELFALSGTADTDGEGRFQLSLPGIETIKLQLLARSADHGAALLRLERVPSREVEMSLDPGLEIPLEVHSAAGSVLSGAEVELRVHPQSFSSWHRSDELDWRRGRSDGSGRVVLQGVPPGRMLLSASAPGFAQTSLELSFNERPTSPVVVVMEPESLLLGTVESVEGVPIGGALLTVRPLPTTLRG